MSLVFDNLANNNEFRAGTFPATRYQGSKYKLTRWLAECLAPLEFDSVLDAFSGTSSVAYMLKAMGKSVIVNDKMNFNYQIALALVENSSVTVDDEDIHFVLKKDKSFAYKDTISKNFSGIYYLDEENTWLDIVTQNIHRIDNQYKKAMLFWALFQACLSKRPYNLFHRNNLNVRTADVKRSFGNKATWDKPFDAHFLKFISQANGAVFDNGRVNKAMTADVAEMRPAEMHVDLVYFDPPYVPQKGSLTLYMDFYHFLEGLTCYERWEEKIDFGSKNNAMIKVKSPWEDRKLITGEFFSCLEKFSASQIAISYREDGIPAIGEIVAKLQELGKTVTVKYMDYKYALSKKTDVREVLITGV